MMYNILEDGVNDRDYTQMTLLYTLQIIYIFVVKWE